LNSLTFIESSSGALLLFIFLRIVTCSSNVMVSDYTILRGRYQKRASNTIIHTTATITTITGAPNKHDLTIFTNTHTRTWYNEGILPVPVPLCKQRITNGPTRPSTQASVVTGWWLTTWDMAEMPMGIQIPTYPTGRPTGPRRPTYPTGMLIGLQTPTYPTGMLNRSTNTHLPNRYFF
jgi:hypothetical protein